MALARVRTTTTIEFTDDALNELGIVIGDEFRVERSGGMLTLVPVDTARAAHEAVARLHAIVRSGERVDPSTLPPITPAEEEAIARYERATARFRTKTPE